MEALDLINIIRPEHNRDSCNDHVISNGFYTSRGGQYRCSRCALLQILEFDEYEVENVKNIIKELML